eukprot:SM000420S15765  [mRNA]  locus=s420:30624:31142:- [translate_table: standard]
MRTRAALLPRLLAHGKDSLLAHGGDGGRVRQEAGRQQLKAGGVGAGKQGGAVGKRRTVAPVRVSKLELTRPPFAYIERMQNHMGTLGPGGSAHRGPKEGRLQSRPEVCEAHTLTCDLSTCHPDDPGKPPLEATGASLSGTLKI